MVANDLINSALRLIKVISPGETPDISESDTGLCVLQDMIDAWNAERLAIFTTGSQDFPLVANQQAYTMGPSGNFNVTRPARIESMSSILLANPTNPIEVPIVMYSVDDWQTKIPVKDVLGSFPQIVYDDGNYPLRTLNVWPIPQDATNKIRIYSWTPLTAISSFQTTIAFPPGYSEAFRYNLAVRLAPEFSQPLDPAVQQTAIESLARIRTMNAPDMTLRSDLIAVEPGYNYRADLFGMGF